MAKDGATALGMSSALRKPTYPRLQPKTLTWMNGALPLPAIGVCGKTGPAEIHLMPFHWPDGAMPTLGRPAGVGVEVGVAGTWLETGIGDGLLRFSVGIEDVADLRRDIDTALKEVIG